MKASTIGLLMSIASGCASVQSPSPEERIPIVISTLERCQGWHERRAELQTLLDQANGAREAGQQNLAEAIINVDQADGLITHLRKQNTNIDEALRERERARVLMKRALANLANGNSVITEIERAIEVSDHDCNN